MRKLLWTAAVMLLLQTLSLGQSGGAAVDDHNDEASVQSGYAVVTPVVPGSSPLSVTETYGLQRGAEILQAGLPVGPLTTSATFFADVSARLDRNLGVSIVNPSAGVASVTLTLRRADGSTLAAKAIAVSSRRQAVEFITSLLPVTSSGGTFGGPSTTVNEYRGTLTVTSSIPVSVLGIRFRGGTFSAETPGGITPAVDFPLILQGVGGNGSFLIPQFVMGGGWATEIVISNPGSSSVTVRLDLFTPDGDALVAGLNGQKSSSFTNVTIPAGGVFVFAPRDANGDDRF